MGGFWSGLKSKFFPPQQIKVFMGGLDAAGKTTILYRLKLGQNIFYTVPTIGFNVEQLKINKNVTIVAWDVGGGCKLRQLFHHYWEDTKALVWIVDSSDRQRIDQVHKELQFTYNHEKLKDCIVLILANKQDYFENPDFMTKQFLIEKLQLNKLTEQKRTWNIIKCNGLTGQGLKQSMDWLAAQLQKNQQK